MGLNMGNIKSGGPMIPPGKHLAKLIAVDDTLTSKAGDPMAKWTLEIYDIQTHDVFGERGYWTVLTEEKGFGLKMLLVDGGLVGPEDEIDEKNLDQYLGSFVGVVMIGDTYVDKKTGEERETTNVERFAKLPEDYKLPAGTAIKKSAVNDSDVPF